MKKREDDSEIKHDFANARRGAILATTGKTRVTMFLDNDVIHFFRRRASERGRGYQTEINEFLRNATAHKDPTKVTTGDQLVRAREAYEVVTLISTPFLKKEDWRDSRMPAEVSKLRFARHLYKGAGRE